VRPDEVTTLVRSNQINLNFDRLSASLLPFDKGEIFSKSDRG